VFHHRAHDGVIITNAQWSKGTNEVVHLPCRMGAISTARVLASDPLTESLWSGGGVRACRGALGDSSKVGPGE